MCLVSNRTCLTIPYLFDAETATWLLTKDKALGQKKGAYGTTCLHLLAKMPSCFKSSCRMRKMETLLYNCTCLQLHLYMLWDAKHH